MGHQREARIDYVLCRLRLPQFSVAFQPIYDAQTGQAHAFEALARGAKGEGYPQLTAGLKARGQRCLDRVAISKALRFAAKHRESWSGSKITVNLRPNLKRAGEDAAFCGAEGAPLWNSPERNHPGTHGNGKDRDCRDLKTFFWTRIIAPVSARPLTTLARGMRGLACWPIAVQRC